MVEMCVCGHPYTDHYAPRGYCQICNKDVYDKFGVCPVGKCPNYTDKEVVDDLLKKQAEDVAIGN